MPVQPPNLPQSQFGGGIAQLLAMVQQQSGTKGGGILDGEIGKAFEMLMNKFFPKPTEEDPAIAAINRLLGPEPTTGPLAPPGGRPLGRGITGGFGFGGGGGSSFGGRKGSLGFG